MSKTLTITLSDALEQALEETAAQSQKSREDIVVQLLTQTLISNDKPNSANDTDDPLMALFGSIESNIPDLAERHDDYLGQALYNEMHLNDE